MLRMSSLHFSPLYRISKMALWKKDYKPKIRNAQYIKELHRQYEHAFFKTSIFGAFVAIYSKQVDQF